MDGRSLAAVLLVGGIVLYYLSKSKGVDAAMLKYQQKQIDDASVQGKLLLVSDTGERLGWVENTDLGPVPVVPTGTTPEQEKEAIRIFDRSLTIITETTTYITDPVVPSGLPGIFIPPAPVGDVFEYMRVNRLYSYMTEWGAHDIAMISWKMRPGYPSPAAVKAELAVNDILIAGFGIPGSSQATQTLRLPSRITNAGVQSPGIYPYTLVLTPVDANINPIGVGVQNGSIRYEGTIL